MRVFITGATGLIGAGVARALRARRHQVVGLARSAATADQLRRAGVDPYLGALADHDRLRAAISSADAVIHAAFARDALEDLPRAAAEEQTAVRAMLATGKPLIYTSGLGVLGDTGDQIATEHTPPNTPPHMIWRRELELATLTARHGLVIRPALVYGDAGGAILTGLIESALAHQAACYRIPGDAVWPNVHVDDLAEAYALALEEAPAATLLNLVGGESTPRAVAEAIGRLIGRPDRTAGLPPEQAQAIAPVTAWIGMTQRVNADRARQLLGWRPTRPTLEHDIEFGSYRQLLPT
ncbi:MAG TPA: NAD-dependent epimerase/dehydratase family protein [Streptosporangiaceae bacterium]